MLSISPISNPYYRKTFATNSRPQLQKIPQKSYNAPTGAGIVSFQRRLTEDIEYEKYKQMPQDVKDKYRDKYNNFYKLIDKNELFIYKMRDNVRLPLSTDEDIKDFLGVASSYNKYRKNKIICVGRSPKWFLNASIWMKNGIEDYSLAAFSSNWYYRNGLGLGPNQYKDENKQPTLEQKLSYRRYMKRIKCDPNSLVRRVQKTGNPIIITDYIHSGCGLASYLDLMSEFATYDGVLDDFAQSIQLFTMGSVEYIEDLGYNTWYALPTVILPEKLAPYKIPQKYHDMSASVLKSILIDKNTNECRSTYYPPAAWTIYNPMKYRTGLIPDERLAAIPRIKDGVVNNYTDAMKDYRNLMNFRILDYLYQNGLLKDSHKTR